MTRQRLSPYRRLARLLAALTLPLVALAGTPPRPALAHVPSYGTGGAVHYAGWAMDAYPGDSTARLRAEMQRQLAAGANVVWLGHNNPGEVGRDKVEPALSYAVWTAVRDAVAPLHADAVAMVQAQQRALDAARALGVRVVFPIGYQTQMGRVWNLAHPDAARRTATGAAYNGPDPSNIGASFYAPLYRRDIVAYYRWIDATFVRPYAGTIMMLNLADEPKDGDYSPWADRAFRALHGYSLRAAGTDPARQQAVGQFESDYIDAYATWSARQWQAIDPAVRVTMSFCGGYGRYLHEGPNLEDVFRGTPSNFVVTFDAYPRDGLYTTPLHDADLIELFNLVRTLGYYSACYHHPLWLWSAANSWGLNEASRDPGHIADAVANGIYLAQLARQTGGDLQGIAVWNYNIHGQGLYNDTHHTAYDPDQMFARVSASFVLLRVIMAAPAGRPDTVILAPEAPAWHTAGAQLALRAADPYHWDALAAPARANVAAVILTHLDARSVAGLRAALVLARSAADLSADDGAALRALLARGGIVVAAAPVARVLAQGAALTGIVARDSALGVTVRRAAMPAGALLSVAGGSVEDVFADAAATWARPVWAQVLRRSVQTRGYVVAAGGVTLFYTIAPGGATTMLADQCGRRAVTLVVYDTHGVPLQTRHLAPGYGPLQVSIARRSYALLS